MKAKAKGHLKEKVILDHPRRKRALPPWGGFIISPIHRKDGPQTGWGVACGAHSDAANPSTKCKKNLTFGKTLSSDEALLRIKMWAVLGCRIANDDPIGRTRHKQIDIKSIPVWTNEEIETLKPPDH